MPWRLIGFICVFIIFLVFIGFNLGDEYRSNISFGFKIIENVPVFYTIFVSFILGVLVSLPVIFSMKKKQKTQDNNDKKTADNKPNDNTKTQDEPAPSYSGGKYFDKDKFKKK